MANLEKQLFNFAVKKFIAPRHHRSDWKQVPASVRKEAQTARDSLLTDNPRGILLMGPVGSGKTSILSLIIMDILRAAVKAVETEGWQRWEQYSIDPDFDWRRRAYNELNIDITSVTHSELIQQLRAHFEGERDGKIICGFPKDLEKRIVFIDDLGVAHDDRSGWNLSLQLDYFDWRWRECLPTFITTNRTAVDGSPMYIRSWPEWERIVDRICDPEFMTTLILNRESLRREL